MFLVHSSAAWWQLTTKLAKHGRREREGGKREKRRKKGRKKKREREKKKKERRERLQSKNLNVCMSMRHQTLQGTKKNRLLIDHAHL